MAAATWTRFQLNYSVCYLCFHPFCPLTLMAVTLVKFNTFPDYKREMNSHHSTERKLILMISSIFKVLRSMEGCKSNSNIRIDMLIIIGSYPILDGPTQVRLPERMFNSRLLDSNCFQLCVERRLSEPESDSLFPQNPGSHLSTLPGPGRGGCHWFQRH